MLWPQPVTLVNAVVLAGGGAIYDSVRIRRTVVDTLGIPPQRGDCVVDLDGAVVVPGLINAHDHLELNSFARMKWRPRHANVSEWIADFQPRFSTDPTLAAAKRETLGDRVWVGGLKNLLSGVTTVCHHNPMHQPLRRRFPVRVVRKFGLSHSLQIDGARVEQSYKKTPATWPWIIHAAEGVDAAAREEIAALEAMQCLGANTVLVHGVALDETSTERVLAREGALVWCPSSNDFLFGRTADVRRFDQRDKLALGTDSRLSGEGDLLDELRAAFRTQQLSAASLFKTVTTAAAAMLRLEHGGRLLPGRPADLAIVARVADDPFRCVVTTSRRNVRLTMVAGEPLFGDVSMRPLFEARAQHHAAVTVDSEPRVLARWVAQRAAKLALGEPGLEVLG